MNNSMGVKELRGIMRSEFRGEIANAIQAYRRMGLNDDDIAQCLIDIGERADEFDMDAVVSSNARNRGNECN